MIKIEAAARLMAGAPDNSQLRVLQPQLVDAFKTVGITFYPTRSFGSDTYPRLGSFSLESSFFLEP